MKLVPLDQVLLAAFGSFAAVQRTRKGHCRERELLSQFVFGHLLPQCRPGHALFDPRQIGIEVGVPQLPSEAEVRRQPYVCKDLAIWEEPDHSCWDACGEVTQYPAAVIEWKSINGHDDGSAQREKREDREKDVKWLKWLVTHHSEPQGYSVLTDATPVELTVDVTRVTARSVEEHWFTSGGTTAA